MGYEIERFVDVKMADNFKCGICWAVWKDPVMISVCEHMFCRECLHVWLRAERRCPEDRTPVRWSDLIKPLRFIRNLHQKLELKCDFAKYGCEEVVPLGSLAAHEADCEFNPSPGPKACDSSEIQPLECSQFPENAFVPSVFEPVGFLPRFGSWRHPSFRYESHVYQPNGYLPGVCKP